MKRKLSFKNIALFFWQCRTMHKRAKFDVRFFPNRGPEPYQVVQTHPTPSSAAWTPSPMSRPFFRLPAVRDVTSLTGAASGVVWRCSEWDRTEAFLPCYIAWCRVYAGYLWTNYFTYIMVRYVVGIGLQLPSNISTAEVTVLGYPKCIVVEGEMQNESIRQF